MPGKGMAAMTTWIARTHLEPPWWVIEVDGVGATQARSLALVESVATDMIATVLDIVEASIEVEVVAELDPALNEEIDSVRASLAELEAMKHETARRSRAMVRHLVDGLGIRGRDAALLLGVSPQRVSQLLRG